MMYLGNIAAGATLDFMWSTNGADGASITRATNGTISVYKNNSTTQSTAGITDTEDFDSLTGVHHCRIDTSADGTFYAAGGNFAVVLSGATIDGKGVNAVLAHFSIQNRYQDKAGYGLADGAITAAKFAAGAIDAAALAADAVDEFHDEVVEGSITLRQAVRLMLAALTGKSSGGGSGTITFRDVADTKNRISATVDANRNRTAVTRDGT